MQRLSVSNSHITSLLISRKLALAGTDAHQGLFACVLKFRSTLREFSTHQTHRYSLFFFNCPLCNLMHFPSSSRRQSTSQNINIKFTSVDCCRSPVDIWLIFISAQSQSQVLSHECQSKSSFLINVSQASLNSLIWPPTLCLISSAEIVFNETSIVMKCLILKSQVLWERQKALCAAFKCLQNVLAVSFLFPQQRDLCGTSTISLF